MGLSVDYILTLGQTCPMSVIILSVISGSLAVTTALFASLYFLLRSRIKNNPNYDTQLIISDMLRSNALIRCERVDPSNIYIHKRRS